MVRNIQEIKNPGGSNHFEQLVSKCLTLWYSALQCFAALQFNVHDGAALLCITVQLASLQMV